jgi:hypothetical protein
LFQAPAYYNFDWTVKDDYSYNNYGQSESRNGDKTEGSYFGNMQKHCYIIVLVDQYLK